MRSPCTAIATTLLLAIAVSACGAASDEERGEATAAQRRDSGGCTAERLRERTCAGAVGNNCCLSSDAENKAGGMLQLRNVGCSEIVDGESGEAAPGALLCYVSVGSLLHDSCCTAHPDGVQCGGSGEPTSECQVEWDHAVNDSMWGRAWQARFTVGRPVATSWRAALRVSRDGEPDAFEPGRDLRPELKAPDGTVLYAFDSDAFCASGRTEPAPLEAEYKTCVAR